MKNTFSERLLPADEATLKDGRVGLGVRLPWYRSLPLSVVEIGELVIDGKPVPTERMRLAINGHTSSTRRDSSSTGRWTRRQTMRSR